MKINIEKRTMKLIKPKEISGKIMTLIEEADEKLILVSPYWKIAYWTKFLKTINSIEEKDILVELYVREGEDNRKSIKEIENIGFTPILVNRLHTKLYFNEKYAIVSSMNLLKSSDEESLDIAYMTETIEEYEELIEYYERYLAISKTDITNPFSSFTFLDWTNFIELELTKNTENKFRLFVENQRIIAQGPNRYFIHISNTGKENNINICGILSSSQMEKIVVHKFEKELKLKVNLYEPGFNGFGYCTIWHHSKISLEGQSINELSKKDYKTVTSFIINFIVSVEHFKNNYYK